MITRSEAPASCRTGGERSPQRVPGIPTRIQAHSLCPLLTMSATDRRIRVCDARRHLCDSTEAVADRVRKLYESLLPFVYAAPGQKLRLREDPDPTYKQVLGLALLEPDALKVVTLVQDG